MRVWFILDEGVFRFRRGCDYAALHLAISLRIPHAQIHSDPPIYTWEVTPQFFDESVFVLHWKHKRVDDNGDR